MKDWNNFFGSKLNSVLLLILIVLMSLALRVMYKNPAVYIDPLFGNTESKELVNTVTYKNLDLGFEFQYPEKYGKVDLLVNPGETGKMFLGILQNTPMSFGGVTSDFSEGRDSEKTDFSGDDETLSYIKQHAGPIYTYSEFKSDGGADGVRVEYVAEDKENELGNTPKPGSVLYYFKLNRMFPGVVFVFYKQETPEYENIIKSLVIYPKLTNSDILGNTADLLSCSVVSGAKMPKGILSYRGELKGAWFFEGNIGIAILDGNKKLLKQDHAMSTTEWMTAGPVAFEGNIDFTGLPAGMGYFEIQNDNASGIPENNKSILIPIILQ